MVKDNLLHLLVNLLLLAKDDVALALDRGVLKLRVLENVADNVHGLADVLAEALGVVHGLLARGVGVQVCAKVLNLELQSVLVALAGALEGHVLKEVGRAVRLVGLRPRARVDPNANGRRLRMWVSLGRDCEAVRERSELGYGCVHRRRK